MRCLIFATLVACSYAAVIPFTWSDCAAGKDTALTIHSLSLSPNPIVFPGNLSVDMNVTINRQITALYIDVQLKKKTAFGPYVEVPCIGDTKIGTCQNINACNILTDILNGTSVVSTDLGLQIQTILLSALGHQPQCPIKPESVIVTKEVLQLKALPAELAAIADGNYNVTMTIKDSPTATENVGCLNFHAGLARASTGFLFG